MEEDVGDFEDEADDERDVDLFPFRVDERPIVDELIKLVREVLGRGKVSAAQVRDISKVLYALERLPRPTPGIAIGLTVAYHYNNECTYCELFISEEEFRISSGGNTYDPGVGSDSYGETLFEMETSGFRDGSADWYQLSGWFDSARELLNMEHRISIEDLGDDGEIDWSDEESEDYWDKLNDEE